MMAARRVLFLAYNFPPHGGPGVQRSLKFVKYLPEFGWQPVVLSAAEEAGPILDPSLVPDIPSGVPVWRLPAFNIQKVLAAADRLGLKRVAVLLNLLLQIPDPGIFWARRARRAAQELIATTRPELIYSTSGPNSSHLAARWIQQDSGLPWLADFRDPWSTNLVIPYLPGYRALNRRLEREVLAAADRVACVSQPWLADLQANLGAQSDKFVLIPNGYDPDDLPQLSRPGAAGPFTLTHTGSLYRNRRPDSFLAAVQLLLERGELNREQIRVRFIGRDSARHIPREALYEAIEYLPHGDLVEYLGKTHVLLLLLDTAPENAGNYSGKLYEYIAANRPILGIVPPGGVAQALIESTRTGLAVDNDPEQIAAAILRLYRDWQAGFPDFHPDWGEIEQYSRRRLTARLAKEFDRLVG
jgi:glycosyltransferase involved in cell wall biosynthesis